ncbi:MAG TPA: sugar porter family MFS transporter [Terracidiphilus sp.]|jgi:sugar porter (SP) family MFS transporter|nr:sugar porter family MFS transporter [Terracidiphilus sp.]
MNRKLIVAALAGSFSGVLFGYDIGAIAGAAPDVRAGFGLTPSGLGLAISSALLGTVAGSIAAGSVADIFGRRKTIAAAGILYAIAILAAAFADALVHFAICRFVCGVAIGVISVAVPMYLAEVAPSRLRGSIVGSFQLSVSIGVVAAFLAGYLFSEHMGARSGWRLVIAGGAVPALLSELFLLFSPASPHWLAICGRVQETQASLAGLGSVRPDLEAGRISASLENANQARHPRLFTRQYIRPIVLAISIAMFNQLTGVNALLYYVLDVFKDLGGGRLNGRADALILSTTSLAVTILAVFIIDRVGRKPLLLAGAVGMGICLLLLPAIRHYAWPASAVVVVFACYNACFGFSQGAVIWIYLSEIFPLAMRARGQSLGTTVHWCANALVVGTFPILASHMGGKVFIGLAVLMALQFLIILLFYPETKCTALESSVA